MMQEAPVTLLKHKVACGCLTDSELMDRVTDMNSFHIGTYKYKVTIHYWSHTVFVLVLTKDNTIGIEHKWKSGVWKRLGGLVIL
ncbi:hypothetical protein GDO81_002134 [Engystomops pustulosus]|uniref:Dynein light chain n=1 Tax=Engystomops pustulosus TaxID=76066 RepID=A0AAV7DHM0_ENGPU|nr:hypothetical protein GDO81_002134 [Engystomops pustulosus]